jgi:hypothetical protein
MARLLRLLPDSASPHEPRSVDPSKIAFVSLAAAANRAKPLQRTMPSRHIEVQCSGGGRLAHGPLANVRTPVGPTGAAQQLFRLARSPPNLRARPSLTQSNRRWYGPVCPVVWEGWRREASPYPDQSCEEIKHQPIFGRLFSGLLSLDRKQMGARSAGNPRAACDVEGARNVARQNRSA